MIDLDEKLRRIHDKVTSNKKGMQRLKKTN